MYPWYEVNIEGSPVCLNEHMIEVARGSNTHVILMDDYQDSESIKIEDLDHDLNKATLEHLDSRKGRGRVTFIEKCDID